MWICSGFQDEPYVAANDGVMIVPLTGKNEVLFIREPARTTGLPVLSLPSGAVNPGMSAAESAQHELQEEIGFRAGRLDHLAGLNPLARHTLWHIDLYLAQDLRPSQIQGDEDYTIEIVPIPFHGFESLIFAGELTDAVVISALYLARTSLTRF
jgi:ADP-ribose diphosphatase